MVAAVTTWNADPNLNGSLDGIPMYEGMPPNLLNDGVRAVMASVFDNDVLIRALIAAEAASRATAISALAMTGVVASLTCLVANIPVGWLHLKGQLISRLAPNDALWTYVQASGLLLASDALWTGNATNQAGFFSPGDGAATFRLMDPRGLFVRAADAGAGVDPGRAEGTLQAHQLQGHEHAVQPYRQEGAGFGYTGSANLDNTNVVQTIGIVTDGAHGAPNVGSETRPSSVAWPLCIHL